LALRSGRAGQRWPTASGLYGVEIDQR
jgi:hypothetical protein